MCLPAVLQQAGRKPPPLQCAAAWGKGAGGREWGDLEKSMTTKPDVLTCAPAGWEEASTSNLCWNLGGEGRDPEKSMTTKEGVLTCSLGGSPHLYPVLQLGE